MQRDEILKKSIEEIENDKWKDLEEYPTNLVKRVHQIRKKKIGDFDLDDYRIAISQNQGVAILIPLIVPTLMKDVLVEALYYPGDLLLVIISNNDYWDSNIQEKATFSHFLKTKKEKIETSDEINNEIKEVLLSKIDHFLQSGNVSE